MHGGAVLDDKFYAMADRGGVVYDPGEASWGHVSTELDLGWRGRAAVVDGILYCYDYLGKIRGYDVKEGIWKELKVVQKDLPKFLCGATMINVGGRLSVVGEEKGTDNQKEMCCAEIEVHKDSNGGLCGSIVWSSTVPELDSVLNRSVCGE